MEDTDFREDAYGRPVHKDLDALAIELTFAMDAKNGKLDSYEIPADRWQRLADLQAKFNGGAVVADGKCDRMNFIWRGIAVCPK